MHKKTIAVVEDDPEIIQIVFHFLEDRGFNTVGFARAEQFFDYLATHNPDMIILDLTLPDQDGIDVCKKIRANKKYAAIPIIMLTGRIDITHKVVGLEVGADDYLAKPFDPEELVARVKAVLRRTALNTEEKTRKFTGENFSIDYDKQEVIDSGKKIELTSTEFKILELFSSRLGWVFDRDQILQHLWGNDKAVVDRTIDVHIRHLRTKLRSLGPCIKNVRGSGYKLEID